MAGPKVAGWSEFEVADAFFDIVVEKYAGSGGKGFDHDEALFTMSNGLMTATGAIEQALQELYERIQRLHQKIDRMEAKIGSAPK